MGSGLMSVPFNSVSGSGEYWSMAPALEYNFNPNIGVIAGAEISFAGRNTSAIATPKIPFSAFF
jgi:hypothetical protein